MWFGLAVLTLLGWTFIFAPRLATYDLPEKARVVSRVGSLQMAQPTS